MQMCLIFMNMSQELVSRLHCSWNFLIKKSILLYINWPNIITRLCLLPKLFNNMFCVSCLGIWWPHYIWISENLKFDYLKNEKQCLSDTKKNIFPALFYQYTKQTSKNVPSKTFKSIFARSCGLFLGGNYSFWKPRILCYFHNFFYLQLGMSHIGPIFAS